MVCGAPLASPDQQGVSPCRALAARSWQQHCAATSRRSAGHGQQQRGLSPGRRTCWGSSAHDRQQATSSASRLPLLVLSHTQQCRQQPPDPVASNTLFSAPHSLRVEGWTASPYPHNAARLTTSVGHRNSSSQRGGGRKTAQWGALLQLASDKRAFIISADLMQRRAHLAAGVRYRQPGMLGEAGLPAGR